MKNEYPESFIKKVNDAFPSNPYNISQRLKNGDHMVGRIIEDSTPSLTPEDVMTGNKEKALNVIMLQELSKEYWAIRDEWQKK